MKALSQDQLTQHTGTDYDASIGKMYHWLVVKVKDTEIRVVRYLEEDVEADSPEMYASWDKHWDGMYAEYLEKLAAI